MKPELLAPAGSAAKLETALRYGADAVYVSDKRYGLRAFADNFTVGGIEEAAARVHACGKKIYVTVNIYAGDGEYIHASTGGGRVMRATFDYFAPDFAKRVIE